MRSGVDTGGHHYCSRVFGAVEIRGILESGMGPYLARVRWKGPPLMGLYPPRTALWSSNQSAINQRDWVFSPCRVVSARESAAARPSGVLLCIAVLLYVVKVWSVGGWRVHFVVRGGWVGRSVRGRLFSSCGR